MREKKPHIVLGIIFLAYLCLALLIYKDFGISADEERNYNLGKETISVLLSPSKRQNVEFDTHNRLYPGLLTLLNPNGYYEHYHLLNLVLAFPIFTALYYLIYFEFKKTSYSVLSVAALLTVPRFFGHLPANPKDGPFAVWFFITFVFIYVFARLKLRNKKRIIALLFLGLLFGVAQSLRVIGFSLYLVYFSTIFIFQRPLKDVLREMAFIFVTSVSFMFLTWPGLSHEPINNFFMLFTNAQGFEAWNNTILFGGEFLTKESRPLEYLPVWFLITTPIYILVLLPLSLNKFKENKLISLAWVAVLTNFLLYMFLNPVVYNGLRHFLYLLPLLLLIVLVFSFSVYSKSFISKAPLFVVLACSFALAFREYKLHPYQYIYFNSFVGGVSGAATNYELDYWGVSYSEAAKWLHEQPYSKIYACNLSYAMQYYSHGKFEMISSSQEADYIVCDHDNWLKHEYTQQVVHEIKVEEVPLTKILKNN